MLSLILTPYRRLLIAALLLSINLGVTNELLPSKIGCKNCIHRNTNNILHTTYYCLLQRNKSCCLGILQKLDVLVQYFPPMVYLIVRCVVDRVTGYHKGTPEAFGPFNNLQTYMSAGVGLDGILISHGDRIEKHIWAYVTGLQRIIKGLITNIVHVLNTGLMALLHHS